MFNHYGLNITLEKPPFPEVPWVYVKDVGTRFPNGRTYSVVMETVGHIGFVNDSPDGGSGYAPLRLIGLIYCTVNITIF